jgi:hypothetical protein
MSNNNKDIIERKLRAIAANVTNCKMDQVSLKLQINTEKNKLGGGMYGTAYKAYASNGKTVPFVVPKFCDLCKMELPLLKHKQIIIFKNPESTGF